MKLLQGVRVLAVEQYGAGPFGSLQLAQLGADVVKIENLREKGDTGRHVRRDGENLPDNDSLFFQTFNLGKRSIVVDLQKPEGQRILRELARDADAVMNNLRGDTQEKLGITYEKLKDVNPRIVCVHLTAYGRRGSRKNTPGVSSAWEWLSRICSAPPRAWLSWVRYLSPARSVYSPQAGHGIRSGYP